MSDVRKHGLPVSVFGPWAQVIAGIVILVWPEPTLWLPAMPRGGGLFQSGITGSTPMHDRELSTLPCTLKIGLWTSIVLGVLLIVIGGFGSGYYPDQRRSSAAA